MSENNAEIKVLDKGFVRLVDFMGNDAAIVQMARTSYGKGTKHLSEDRILIRYLMRNKHTSPFESCEFKFHMKLPIVVARQMIRHRTASVNEISGRYSELPEEYYVPNKERFVKQSSSNKQGSSEELIENIDYYQDLVEIEAKNSFETYRNLLNTGLTRELARINLPLSTYTEWYWKMDLHNLLHFLRLRLDSHAQYEIRQYALAIYNLIKPIVPLSIEAFEDYTLNSMTLSKQEIETLNKIVNSIKSTDIDVEETINDQSSQFTNNREKQEFLDKLKKLIP